MKTIARLTTLIFLIVTSSCEVLDDDVQMHVKDDSTYYIPLNEIAGILSEIPLRREHIDEVRQAVSSSSLNGYDEEYMMKDLFEEPGRGVGDPTSPMPRPSTSTPPVGTVPVISRKSSLISIT